MSVNGITMANLATTQLNRDELEEVLLERQILDAMDKDLKKLTPEYVQSLLREAQLVLLYRIRTSLDPRFTLQQQADLFGISLTSLKRLAGSEEYQAVAERVATPSRDEIYGAVQDHLNDTILPKAIQRLQEILEAPQTKTSMLLAAIKMVFDQTLAKHQTNKTAETERREAMEFLKGRGVLVNNINVVIQNAPAELSEALKKYIPQDYEDVVDADST